MKHRSTQYLVLSFQAIQFPLYLQDCKNDIFYFEYTVNLTFFTSSELPPVMGADWCGIFFAYHIFRVCSTDLSFAADIPLYLFFSVVCHSFLLVFTMPLTLHVYFLSFFDLDFIDFCHGLYCFISLSSWGLFSLRWHLRLLTLDFSSLLEVYSLCYILSSCVALTLLSPILLC